MTIRITTEVDNEFENFNLITHIFTLYTDDEEEVEVGSAFVYEISPEQESLEDICDYISQDCYDCYNVIFDYAYSNSIVIGDFIDGNSPYTYLYLDKIKIEKEYRRMGYGTQLMKFIKNWYDHYFYQQSMLFFMSGSIDVDKNDKKAVSDDINQNNKFYKTISGISPIVRATDNNCTYYVMGCMESIYTIPKNFKTLKLKTLDNE